MLLSIFYCLSLIQYNVIKGQSNKGTIYNPLHCSVCLHDSILQVLCIITSGKLNYYVLFLLYAQINIKHLLYILILYSPK